MLVDRLSQKLREYQNQLHVPESEFQELFVVPPTDLEKESFNYAFGNGDYFSMLSSHLLGPLFVEYEA